MAPGSQSCLLIPSVADAALWLRADPRHRVGYKESIVTGGSSASCRPTSCGLLIQFIGPIGSKSIQHLSLDRRFRLALDHRIRDIVPVPHPDPTQPSPVGIQRDHPIARRIILAWRRLVGAAGGKSSGEPTVIACSGGADSIALALSIHATKTPLVLAFAQHDARPVEVVAKDRSIVQQLSLDLRCPFKLLDCPTPDADSNTEDSMRRQRYRALADLAREIGFRFVATGHHADDQLETVLMGLIRGSGLAGMGGVPPSRPIDARLPKVELLRPMLGVTRSDCEQLCKQAGFSRPGHGVRVWAEDETNRDQAYLRNHLRHSIVPQLTAIRPGLAIRVSRNAEWLRQAGELVRDIALAAGQDARMEPGIEDYSWDRAKLRDHKPLVLGELIRQTLRALSAGKGSDRVSAEKLSQIAEAIRDEKTDPRTFEIGSEAAVILTAHAVNLRVSRKKSPE